MTHTEKYARVELRRPVKGNRELVDVEVEHIGSLCRIDALGVSFPLSHVLEFVHAPRTQAVPKQENKKESTPRASAKKKAKSPAKTKPTVRTPKRVRPKSE